MAVVQVQQPVMVVQQPAPVMMAPVATVQPMMMMMPGQAMPGAQAPGQEKMDKEYAYLDFNQMKSMILNTSEGNVILYEQNMECQDWTKDACLCCCTCGGCRLKEYKFKGPGHALKVHKPQGCCTKWTVAVDSKGSVGFSQPASCCAGGIMFCIAKYGFCWGTDKYYEFKRKGGRSDGEEVFTLRKKLFPCWCCCDVLCNQLAALNGPIADCCGDCCACCKYCAGSEYKTLKQPIYGPWGTGSEPVGSISQVERAVPYDCCRANMEPVRVSLEMPGSTKHDDVASLAFLTLAYSRRVEVDFQMPKGNPMLDCGLTVETKWESFEDMVNQNSAASGVTGNERD